MNENVSQLSYDSEFKVALAATIEALELKDILTVISYGSLINGDVKLRPNSAGILQSDADILIIVNHFGSTLRTFEYNKWSPRIPKAQVSVTDPEYLLHHMDDPDGTIVRAIIDGVVLQGNVPANLSRLAQRIYTSKVPITRTQKHQPLTDSIGD